MKKKAGEIYFEAIDNKNQLIYSDLGRRSYTGQYSHLWRNNDPGPYIRKSFTGKVVSAEMEDPRIAHFIIYQENRPVGIIKLISDRAVSHFLPHESLFLEKLYLLKEYTGQGIGGQALRFTEKFAMGRQKNVVWLDTMQEGPALGFYLKNGYGVLKEKMLQFTDVRESKRAMFILLKKLGASF